MRLLLRIVLLPLILITAALLLLWLPLPEGFPAPFSGERSRIAAVVVGLLAAASLLRLMMHVVATVRGAASAFDPVFGSLGLAPGPWLAVGRRYRGQVKGRWMDVRFVPSRVPRPALMSISVSSDHPHHATLGARRPLPVTGCTRIQHDRSGLAHLQVAANDERWIRERLVQTGVPAALMELLPAGEQHGLRELYLEPGSVRLRWHPSPAVTGRDVREAVDHLLTVSEELERHA